MSTLWLKSPDEALLYARFSAAEKKKLEDIFSATDKESPWNKALALLRFSGTAEKLVCWHNDTPYFNGSALTQAVSGGAIHAAAAEGGAYRFQVRYSPRDLWALLACQWKTVRFMQRPAAAGEELTESIALGLVLQSLVLRLGRDENRLAAWLAGGDIPKKHRKTVAQIQAVQMRRTHLSPVWKELFPDRPDSDAGNKSLPDYFWDAPPFETLQAAHVAVSGEKQWQGLPVCAGRVTGIAALAERGDFESLAKKYNAPVILVFRRARPETTELFGHAAALLFAEGGVLSHACTVAREMNIPAVTGLGAGFFEQMRGDKEVWLSVDGGTGAVSIVAAKIH